MRCSFTARGWSLLCVTLFALLPLGGGVLPAGEIGSPRWLALAPVAEGGAAEAQPKAASWAEISIKGTYPEAAKSADVFSQLQPSLRDVLGRLEKAAADKNVHGVLLKIQELEVGWGTVHEFRAAIAKVKAAGKPVLVYAEGFGNGTFAIASAADRVVMPAAGMLLLTGLQAEVGFYKNMLDLLDIKAEMLKVGDFKSAAEPYTRTTLSEPARLQLEELLDDTYGYLVAAVETGRKLDAAAARQAVDRGPYSGAGAQAAGLVDALVYEDEVTPLLTELSGGQTAEISKDYAKPKIDTDFEGLAGMMKLMNLMMGVEPKTRGSQTPKVAVIYLVGPIMPGKSISDPLAGNLVGSDTLVAAVRKAAEDKTVKAIVLRVNSPGGSALASDLIWRALEASGKPVVASMGDVAASGGYYVAMGADYIYAEPTTITGSIGVVGGKLAMDGLYRKLGITTDIVSRGENAGVLSATLGFTDSQRAAMQKLLDETYHEFTTKAAQGRGLEVDALVKLAGGRVYSGTDALDHKLIDGLGTLDDAIAKARELASLAPDAKVEVLELPKPTSLLEQLVGPVDGATASLGLLTPDPLLKLALERCPQLRWLPQLMASDPRLLLLPYELSVR